MLVQTIFTVKILIIFQAGILGAFLLNHPKGKHLSYKLLAALLAVVAFHMLDSVLVTKQVVGKSFDFTHTFGFLHGPLFFLYTRTLVYQNTGIGKKDRWHALPYLVAIGWTTGQFWYYNYLGLLIIFSLGIYLWFSFGLLRYYQSVLAQTHTSYQGYNLRWLQTGLKAFVLIYLLDTLGFIIQFTLLKNWFLPIQLLDYLLILVTLTYMVFKGLGHPEIFRGLNSQEVAIATPEKYAYSSLSSLQQNTYAQQLDAYLLEHEIFVDSSLTLTQLSEKTAIPTRKLSQTINSEFGQNFSEFINSYRINYVKQRLCQAPTIAEVMYDAGFSSRSSFNQAFKKNTGLTPSQYKQQHC